MSRKLPKLTTWLTPKLRRLSMQWAGKSIARDNAKIYIQDGYYKNGNPKIIRYYVCQNPECGLIVDEENSQMDHIEPVVSVDGFTTWDNYIETLFSNPNNYACLCLTCHAEKTRLENEIRLINKNKK